MYKTTRNCLFLLVSTLFACSTIFAAEIFKPLPEHELLKKFEGTWDYQKESIAKRRKPVKIRGKGTVQGLKVGPYFAVLKWTGVDYETKYQAVQTLGYDAEKKQYVNSRIDSLQNYRWHYTGTFSEVGNELILAATGPGPSGEISEFRQRYLFPAVDTILIVTEMKQKNRWVAIMNARLSQKKKPKSAKLYELLGK